jgi:hypothetical protein
MDYGLIKIKAARAVWLGARNAEMKLREEMHDEIRAFIDAEAQKIVGTTALDFDWAQIFRTLAEVGPGVMVEVFRLYLMPKSWCHSPENVTAALREIARHPDYGKIEAVKLYKEINSVGLREAVDAIRVLQND